MRITRAVAFAVAFLAASNPAHAAIGPITVEWAFAADSVAIGTESVSGGQVYVLDGLGQPASGVAYEYTVDPSCARFAEGAVYVGTSNDGRADSPRFIGVARSLSCAVTLRIEGVADPILFPVHVFASEDVVLETQLANLDVVRGSQFVLAVDAHADGLPVNVTNLAVVIGASDSGATAVLDRGILYAINTGRYGAGFLANDRPGSYEIKVISGTASASTMVRHRPK